MPAHPAPIDSPDVLRESVVHEALDRLDWPRLKAHLDDAVPSDLGQLVALITRRSNLIRKYPNPDFQSRRRRFARHLRTYARTQFTDRTASRIDAAFALIDDIERGYHEILSTLKATETGRRPSALRVAAVISRLWDEHQVIADATDRHLASPRRHEPMPNSQLQDDQGNSFSPDAALSRLSEIVSMTLVMEATQNQWFRTDGIVKLPNLPQASEQDRLEAFSTYLLALAWHHWQHMEKSARFLGGELRWHLPDAAQNPKRPSTVSYTTPADGPSDAERYDVIASQRLQDQFFQSALPVALPHPISRRYVGIHNGAALPPQQIISWEEILAGSMLSDMLGYSIIHDQSKPRGLRLVEWIRGYTVLKELAKGPETTDHKFPTPSPLRIYDLDDLSRTLETCGLSRDAARAFIDNVSLSRRSRDCLDCPLVRVGSRGALLLAPLLLAQNIALALLSNLGRQGEHLGRKGAAFEVAVRDIFTRQNLNATTFKATRHGQVFQYDAVIPWDGYLFVFECKNRSLPAGEPASIYYFDLDVKSAARQTRRLTDALAHYPDILRTHLGKEFEQHQIIPCVVHSLPYARLGDIDGVYFTDYSALTRFFENRYFSVAMAPSGDSIPISDIWGSDSPSVAAFLTQLQHPFQVRLGFQHLELNTISFPLSNSVAGQRQELTHSERTTESMCDAMGVDSGPILAQLAELTQGEPRAMAPTRSSPHPDNPSG